ncbi:MAG TPA: hypothetical protein DCO77_07800 [Nitrospiraceae bacterium]|nr:hypothetical protein [Nitrospiraceae bacterium]
MGPKKEFRGVDNAFLHVLAALTVVMLLAFAPVLAQEGTAWGAGKAEQDVKKTAKSAHKQGKKASRDIHKQGKKASKKIHKQGKKASKKIHKQGKKAGKAMGNTFRKAHEDVRKVVEK